jgi:hypothetical protein
MMALVRSMGLSFCCGSAPVTVEPQRRSGRKD